MNRSVPENFQRKNFNGFRICIWKGGRIFFLTVFAYPKLGDAGRMRVKTEKFTPLATNFTLPLGLTGWTNSTSAAVADFFCWKRSCVASTSRPHFKTQTSFTLELKVNFTCNSHNNLIDLMYIMLWINNQYFPNAYTADATFLRRELSENGGGQIELRTAQNKKFLPLQNFCSLLSTR